ncbi:MAG: hypothetical protein PUJ82_15880 [Spirochaetales bacterium]|nr:hypothetical protein [Spirochaetales bacterium]MDD7612389.1 hypothetical protein [Spirochaetales bacterium]
MKKNMLPIFVLLFCTVSIRAEAPELKNIMPNSWEKLTRLTQLEEEAFFKEESVINIKKSFMNDEFMYISPDKIVSRVYKENCAEITFYRLLMTNCDFDYFVSQEYKNMRLTSDEITEFYNIKSITSIFVENKKTVSPITFMVYRGFGATQDKWDYFTFDDVLIKQLNSKEIGFFRTTVGIGFYKKKNIYGYDVIYDETKGQIRGTNSASFRRVKIEKDFYKSYNDSDEISITVSDCLVDSKCPLKYSIQNAFDGNPATSYVENTEDDLMKIVIKGLNIRKDPQVRFAIINGYASNKNLYEFNNRIKLCGLKNAEKKPFIINIDDNNMEYQIKTINRNNDAYYGMFEFIITSVFPGMKYNDSCIGELNFFDSKNNLWIFGEINE